MHRVSAVLAATVLLVFAGSAAAQEFAAVVTAGAAVSGTSARGSTSAIVRLDVETPHVDIGRGWDISVDAGVGRQPLFVMIKTTPTSPVAPGHADGLMIAGGFRIAHALTRTRTRTAIAIVGRVGSARIGSAEAALASNDINAWATVFDGGVAFSWLDPLLDIHAGLRHDQRLHRAGDLSDFRDPTGRIVLGAGAYPIRIGWFAAGASLEYERAMPGANRLPSGVTVAATGRLRWPPN